MQATVVTRLEWLKRVRPAALASILRSVLAPGETRQLLKTNHGEQFYADPLSNFGSAIAKTGDYEPHMRAVIDQYLVSGMTFLDVGANEGFFSILAAKKGCRVVAVEPQSRLQDVLAINAAINDVEVNIVHSALSDAGSVKINLWPSLNTGASSAVVRYLWTRETEIVAGVTLRALLDQHNIHRVDLLKCDVEGYEAFIVPMIAEDADRIAAVALDYHEPQLAKIGVTIEKLHNIMCGAGYRSQHGGASGYNLYTRG